VLALVVNALAPGTRVMLGRMPAAAAIVLVTANAVLMSIRALEFSERMRSYSEYWESTDDRLRAAARAGESTVSIRVQQDWAGLDGPSTDPGFWVNGCMATYYGVQVRASE
jgi:hypothetical protein